MADSRIKREPMSPLVERVERRVGRVASAAAEYVASQPRGQQLFRQADRLMELMERLARALVRALNRPWRRSNPRGDGVTDVDAGGDGKDRWGQPPMPLSTAIPLVIVVLPSYVAATLLVMAPYIPILVIRVIFGPSPVMEECWPTPANAVKCLRLWRRRLRGIRFSGLRKMRIMSIIAYERLEQMLLKKEVKEIIGNEREEEDKEEEEEEEGGKEEEGKEEEEAYNSVGLETVLLWWPITLLALCGQILGLGDPLVPVLKSPVRNKLALESSEESSKEENTPKSNTENVSPRKRKFMDFEADDLPTNQEIAYGLGEILHPTLKSGALEAVPEVLDSFTDSSSEYNSGSDTDSETLAGSVDLSKSEIQIKRLSPLAKLLTDSPLSSEDEEDDPNYVPNPDEESGDEEVDDDVSEDNEDNDNERTLKEIEESIGKESKEFIEMEKESKGMESQKIYEIESKESNEKESKKISEMETKECNGKESEKSNEKKTKEPVGKVFTENDNCDNSHST